ncbi:ATP-grasp domain-containing protein, partial [Staphylococcus aureus]
LFRGGEDLAGAFAALGGVPLILESFIAFEREISIIAARFRDGTVTCYDPAENVHLNGILHTSTVPAALSDAARGIAVKSAEKLLA